MIMTGPGQKPGAGATTRKEPNYDANPDEGERRPVHEANG